MADAEDEEKFELELSTTLLDESESELEARELSGEELSELDPGAGLLSLLPPPQAARARAAIAALKRNRGNIVNLLVLEKTFSADNATKRKYKNAMPILRNQNRNVIRANPKWDIDHIELLADWNQCARIIVNT